MEEPFDRIPLVIQYEYDGLDTTTHHRGQFLHGQLPVVRISMDALDVAKNDSQTAVADEEDGTSKTQIARCKSSSECAPYIASDVKT